MNHLSVLLEELDVLCPTDQELYEKLQKNLIKNTISCLYCHNEGCLHSHGYYERDMITIIDSERREITVRIRRYYCTICEKSVALIPDILIPKGSYSIRFILHVLAEYNKHSCSVVTLCSHWNISTSTLYSWKKLLKTYDMQLQDLLQRIKKETT